MNTCLRCHETETTGALCTPCRKATRAAVVAYAAPIFAAREAEKAADRERARKAFMKLRGLGAI